MLKSLSLTNFQAHERTVVEFGPRLTCIVGASNQGKTSLLRAVGWILRNRPRGAGFIRDGSDAADATLVTDGGSVTRRRDRRGRVNQYEVGGETLEAMGADVPAQVTDLLGLTDINVADQLSQHYLLLDPPGQIARTLNEAVHLERAEAVVDKANLAVRDARGRAKDLAALLEAASVALGTFSWVGGGRLALDRVTALNASLDGSRVSLADLKAARDRLAAVEADLARVAVPAGAAGLLASAEADAARLAIGQQDHAAVSQAARTLEDLGGRVSGLSVPKGVPFRVAYLEVGYEDVERDGRKLDDLFGLITRLVGLSFEQPDLPTARLAELEGLAGDWFKMAKEADDLFSLGEGLGKAEADACIPRGIVDVLEEGEEELIGQLAICPACGQPLDEKAKAKLMEEAV